MHSISKGAETRQDSVCYSFPTPWTRCRVNSNKMGTMALLCTPFLEETQAYYTRADPAVSLSRPRSTSSRDFCDRNKMPPPQAACREHPQFALKPCPCQPAFLKHPCRSRSHQWLNPTAAAVFALSKQNATVSCPTRPLPRTAAPALLSCHRHRVTVSPSPSCGLGPPSCSHSRE